MDFYHKDVSPPSRAVYATIKHLGLAHNLKELKDFMETRSEEFIKLNPARQVPLLVDNGFILTESRAIMAYLVNQYSPNHPIYPSDPKTRAQVDRILYFDGTNLFPALKASFIPRCFYRKLPSEEQNQAVHNAVDELLALKGDNRFMTGSAATLADISLAMSFEFIRNFYPEDAQKLLGWYQEVEKAIPSVKEINDSVDFSIYKEMLKITA